MCTHIPALEKSDFVVTLEMAHSLHLPVVVEGVETNEQANMLRQMGARDAQGFLYYRPMPTKDFEALLDGGNNN